MDSTKWPATEVAMREVSALVPYARNARTHSKSQVDKIAASITEWGWTNPVLVAEDQTIIAGHGRVLAAQKLGIADVPCMVAKGWTEAQKRAYVIADNQLALDAGWDRDMLKVEIGDLAGMDFDLGLMGFPELELEGLLGDAEKAESEGDIVEDQPGEIPENPVNVTGDLWQLGEHRLLCGDCRNPDSVAIVMDGQEINVAFTSPPYASQRKYDEKSGFKPIPPDDYVRWFEAVQDGISNHLADDGSFFVNIKPYADGLDTSLYVIDLIAAHVRKWGWHFATEFCWERRGVPKGVTQRFKNQFEPVYQFARGRWKMRPESVRHKSNSVPQAIGKGAGDTGWGDKRQGKGGDTVLPNEVKEGLAFPGNRLPSFGNVEAFGHTAAFPVGLPSFFIQAFSDNADVIMDPFLGSGTTLIAAEQLGRRCFGLEISPKYCDVIVQRWQKLTGKEAINAETGESFNDAKRAKEVA